MILIAVVLMAGVLAAPAGRPDDSLAIAKQLFPAPLAADSPRRLVGAVSSGSLIFAAYSNGYSGTVQVIGRTATEPHVICRSSFKNMMGKAPKVELRDLDGNGAPEILASFSDQYGTEAYWIFRWTGQELELLSETDNDDVTGVDSDITNPMFVDMDGNGTIEVIDDKAVVSPDDDGGRTVEPVYTVYALRDGRLSPSATPVLFAGAFVGGKGKPARIDGNFVIKTSGDYRLRLVTGSGATAAVTSAHIWVNDVAVLTPEDLKTTEKVVTRKVNAVPGSNTIAVEVGGQSGSEVWVFVEGVQ